MVHGVLPPETALGGWQVLHRVGHHARQPHGAPVHARGGVGVVDGEHGAAEALHGGVMRGDRVGGEHQVHRVACVHRAERGDGGLAAGGMGGRVVPVAHSQCVEHQVHQLDGEHGLGWVQLVDISAGWGGSVG